KESGKVFFTNPPRRDEFETVAKNFNKTRLGSQLLIHYFTAGDDPVTWDSVQESLAYDQVNRERIEDGIRVNYLLGEEWEATDYLPVMMDQEFYEQTILDKLDNSDMMGEDEKDKIRNNYWQLTLERPENEEKDLRYIEVSPLIEEKELFQGYVLKLTDATGKEIDLNIREDEGDFPVYRKEDTVEYILRELIEGSGYTELSEIKHENLLVFENDLLLLNSELFPHQEKEIAGIIRELGITPENIIEQHLKYNITIPFRNIRLFEIPLVYKLDQEDLIVEIPVDEIYYPQKVMNQEGFEETMPLVAVDVLPFFAAGNVEDDGYMMVPDGSGALINLNNGKEKYGEYKKSLYGQDPTLDEKKNKSLNEQKSRMPVYGLKKGDQAFLAIIEEGDAFSEIRAKVPNRVNSYNTVYSRFNILPYTNMTLTGAVEGGANVNVYQERLIKENIKIRYKFLSGEEANYSGMANKYRSYLRNTFGWERLPETNQLPFLLEVEGSFHENLPQLGLTRRTVLPLTTFSETKEMIEELNNRDIENINLLYRGWFEGGPHHVYPNQFSVAREVGGEKELKALNEFLQDREINFYPEINFSRIYHNSLFDGFVSLFDGARFLTGNPARIYDYNQATGRFIPDRYDYLLSPLNFNHLVNGFLGDYKQLDVNGLAVNDMGDEYYSNFRRNKQLLVDRGQTVTLIQKQLKKINEEIQKIMVRGGNIPSLNHTNFVVEAPLLGGSDNLLDRSIPFYQMVLKGYINYSGSPFNMSNTPRESFLKLIETGAIPYFRGRYRESDLYLESVFNKNYSIYYQDWISSAGEVYHQANEVLKDLQNDFIVKHEKIEKNVFITEYDSGISIIVNYNEKPVTFKEEKIAGQDFKLFRK
ncbi:MAG: DUF5696 domain-containing protein, partial [Halanaerobiales bacterium]